MTIQTQARDIIGILTYIYDDETEGINRTRKYLESWLKIASPDMLGKFIKCISGSTGTTVDMTLMVFSIILLTCELILFRFHSNRCQFMAHVQLRTSMMTNT